MQSTASRGPLAAESTALSVVGYVPLGGRDGVRAWTKVDGGADLAWASGYCWSFNGHGYARRRLEGGGYYPAIHRELLGLQKGDGLQVDHINGDRLDNRRQNLRIVTQAQNKQNRRAEVPNKTSQYRGVCWERRRLRWMAYGRAHGQQAFLGYFDIEHDAAKVAAQWRRENLPFATI